MYGNTIRSEEYQSRLLEFVRSEYGLDAIKLCATKRGYYGETWRLETPERRFFLKAVYTPAHRPVYERSFHVMEHLTSHGVTNISAIVKSVSGGLYTRFDSAALGVFEWIEGENVQDQRTKIAEYQILGQVYSVPINGLTIARHEFGTGSARLFYQQWNALQDAQPREEAWRISALLEENRGNLADRAERLALFAKRCGRDSSRVYITHGDAGGNIIVSDKGFYLVDWDDARLAPPERDAWFCLGWEWARNAFNDALRRNTIDYVLRPERLAYFGYHSFFDYLTIYLRTFFDLGTSGVAEQVSEYFQGWMKEALGYADAIV